jgi:23S rRNA pseudouridine1911/1915/1917 synthase
MPPLKIVYEDDDFIAVDKPVGLLSVESDKERDCAFGWVMEYLRSKDKSARPYVMHRIDKETSGVLIFAKNIKIHSMLKLHWNDCVMLRQYHAVVQGKLDKKEDTVVSYLKENVNNLMYVTHDPTGQKAITHYKVLKEKEDYAFLCVQIETGRKNQIRAQMKALGAPVVGDEKYGDGKGPFGRLGLHASLLKFKHPLTGEEICISAPCPSAFRSFFP